MRYFYSLILFFLLTTTYAQVYQPVTYHFNGTSTNGVKIKTNMPFVVGNSMPTIIIEGYNYGTGEAIGIMINYYIYSPGGVVGDPSTYYFIKYNATSYGAYTPPIKLANENNKVVIYIDSKDYFQRFMVRAFSKGLSEQTTWFDGWTVVDEALTGTAQVTVPYRSRFKNEVYLDGALSIGTVATSGNIAVTRPLSSTNSISIHNASTIKKGVASMTYFNSNTVTEADTFNVSNIYHYAINQSPLGANSSVSNQYGFIVHNTMTGAANNYGYYGNINAGTGRWNLYMNGSANNYLGGKLGIGANALVDRNLQLALPITGNTTAYGFLNNGTIASGVTTAAHVNYGLFSTSAASFNVASVSLYTAAQGTIGAGSSIGTNVGFWATPSLATGTNVFGFRGGIIAGTGKWNLYMDGTAGNYLEGSVGIGTTAVPTGYKMAVLGKVIAEEIKVRKQANGWPDYVFSSTYQLPSLNEVEKFIKKNSHLPEIPSAKEIEENGLVLGEMNAKLLQKIEELTLYAIEQDKKLIALEKQNAQLERQNVKLEAYNKELISIRSEINELKSILKK